ncbi:class I tRNA ligase family protein, partial [Candidatus Saccharibacteria bacterium]|nr:class I tRNA ligase family protein [Candidatus Saccharibacteria bacterium]
HAVMHLLYARFWTKVMFDAGLISFEEPFRTLRNHGMILAPNGQKMSKSKNNTIEPDGLIDQGYGADAIRTLELFIGPWNQMANWSVEGLGGAFRFLQRSWSIVQEYLGPKTTGQTNQPAVMAAAHQAIAKVSQDLEELGFNTAIASLMEYVNTLLKLKAGAGFADRLAWQFAVTSLVQLLAPFAPHIAEELWQQLA